VPWIPKTRDVDGDTAKSDIRKNGGSGEKASRKEKLNHISFPSPGKRVVGKRSGETGEIRKYKNLPPPPALEKRKQQQDDES